MINLDLLSLSKGIIVKDNGAVHINGGTIVIDIDSLEKWELLKEKFDDNNVFEFIIIDGFYTGQFNDILIRVMINNGDDNNAHAFELIKVGGCEKIDAELNYKERSLSAIFTLDESECGDSNGSKGVKWWLIVIITCSILIVLLIIFILLVTFNEKVRSHVLPYH